jgi:hypothetical protein
MAEATEKYDFSKLNTLAAVSLASALTLFGAPAALLTGFLALAQIKQSQEKGRWMAITGIALAFAAIVLAILLTILQVYIALKLGDSFMHDRRHFDDDRFGWDMDPLPGQN